jgi:predicted GNAT family acetyltransferase
MRRPIRSSSASSFRFRDGETYGDDPPLLGFVEDAGGIVAIAVRTPPYDLLLREEREKTEAIERIAEHLADAAVRLPGVHAGRTTAVRFAATWSRAAGCSCELAMEQRLYRLTEVTAPSGVPGQFRLAGSEDVARLVESVEGFVAEAVGDGPHTDSADLVDRLTKAEALAVWDDGRPVSMASSTRPTPNGISINLVYTPPESRRLGYASACVAGLSRRRLDKGKHFCTLFTDLANPTSNAIYRRVGYLPIGDFVEIRFRDDARSAGPLDGREEPI